MTEIEDVETEEKTSTGVAWAHAAEFIAVLVFIGTLVYLAHNHWHF
jgi:hypothetical protein